MVDVPIVVPPAVAGLALLFVFGRFGLLGPALGALHLRVAFTTLAVVLAQLFVSAPWTKEQVEAAFAGAGALLD